MSPSSSWDSKVPHINKLMIQIVEVERHSAEIYRKIANECLPSSVKMVEDVPSNHIDGKLEILNLVGKIRTLSSESYSRALDFKCGMYHT